MAGEGERVKHTKTNNRCLENVHHSEPIFVLRAQDRFSDILVDLWVRMAKLHGVSEEKTAEAEECAIYMRGWIDRKIPD